MIQLDLKDAVLVEGLHPLFPKAFDYLRHADFQKMEDGKHEIDGENLFLSVQTFDGKGDDAPMEYHQAYIDIQMCIEGVEQMGWRPTSGLVEQISPYDAEKDIAFYQDKPTSVATVYPQGCCQSEKINQEVVWRNVIFLFIRKLTPPYTNKPKN